MGRYPRLPQPHKERHSQTETAGEGSGYVGEILGGPGNLQKQQLFAAKTPL